MSADTDILFNVVDGIGFILLNRPKALNALTHDMCVRLDKQLIAWAADPAVRAVIIEGEGEKAFCAGGDIRALYDAGSAGALQSRQFFFEEYLMNSRIHHFPKPYIALIDGISMGGGFGVSAHGSHLIVTERTLFAMPETGIGLIPDVGGSYVLSRLPGQIGLYVGLTGARFKAADCIYMGMGTHYVPSEKLADLKAELRAGGDVDQVLAKFAEDAGPAPLAQLRGDIDRAFSLATVEGVVDSLTVMATDWAKKTRDQILSKSPTSLKLTNRQLRTGASLDFNDGLRMEYRIVSRILEGHDLFEGVRAVIVDKDNTPKWKPDTLESVLDAEVDRYFATLGDAELTFN